MATPAISIKVQECLDALAEMDKDELKEFLRLLEAKYGSSMH